jgi:hypothetical protein
MRLPQGRMSFMMICTTNYVNIDNNFFKKNFFIVDMAKNLSIHAPITLEELGATLKPKATTPGPGGMFDTYLKKLRDIIVNAWNLRCKL